jgi:hypothetical protein
MDVVLAHMGLDMQHHRLARAAEQAEGAARAEHQVADAVAVDHGVVGPGAVDQSAQPGDHRATCSRMPAMLASVWR